MKTKMKLELWEIMMIRACKKNKYSTRTLRRIYGASRALSLAYTPIEYATNGLMEIITKLDLVRDWHSFIVDIDHHRTAFWYSLCNDHDKYKMDFNEAFLLKCASLLALTEASQLPGYRSPRRFRNKTD